MPTDSYVPFSQRTGLKPIPPQLKLGEASLELRNLIDYAIRLEIDRETYASYSSAVFKDDWKRVAMDIHVRFFGRAISEFRHGPYENQRHYSRYVETANFGELFDFVEYLVRHPLVSAELKREIGEAFITSRAAYRVFDNQFVAAIGTDEQAEAFERAISDAEAKNATAARKQLIAASVALRNGDWPGSVRESIHAVEAAAVRLAPDTNVLGDALKTLERSGKLHGGLKSAFSALYGFSSRQGVRHALVFGDNANVDEADALFMLGACASFVSYLLTRNQQ
ncbi:MAG: hypothetical protein NW203_06695 [Hyphomonadaceae bacterium]|nr:hypothetical protein [Hyphomonadaceae bacterium]